MVLRFNSSNGTVDLNVERYEFQSAEDRFDANWLQVSARYRTKFGQATVSSACLLAWELKEIRSNLVENRFGEFSLRFMEPEISFYRKNNFEKCIILLRFNLVAPWFDVEERRAGIEFFLEPSQEEWIRQHLTTLDNLCARYPERVF
ncbi:hypothetical protein [Pelagibius sp. Alg239-R121]|uniref:WapI family immunity protein n=1 Tax=Pelagibius sp. Alg239-R121 TaxID=2993448 RepID=UPI0024A79CA2|nr:hypothetical protein [Pelagibius sp. Alg239-R121]